jgi:cytoskeleton protein RodZ
VTGLETEAPSRPGELPAEASDTSSVVSGPTGNQTDQDRILPYAGKEAEDINASLMANGSQPSFQDRAYSEQQFSSVAEPSVPSPADQEDSAIKGHELRIKADMDCWMRVVSDDYSRQLFLRPGQEVVFGFDRSVSVKFGNAGGVRLFLDGSPYPFDAQSGEVKSLVLTADDIQSQG